jgi:CheY-like chemotaxis protein
VARRRRPDLIVVELRMNGMNGLELLARLKAEPSFAAVPVVALTASVLSWEWAAANASDFAEVLSKPCLPDHVADVITRILSAVSTPAIAAPPPPAVLHTAGLTAD